MVNGLIERLGQLSLIWLSLSAATCSAAAEAKMLQLSPVEQRLLEGLLKDVLVEPQGKQYVRVMIGETARCGWLVLDGKGKPLTIYFTDGESMALPDGVQPEAIDFIKHCRARYIEPSLLWSDEKEHRRHLGPGEQFDLVNAAWLYRLGQPGLAALVLAQSRREPDDSKRQDRRDAEENAAIDSRNVRLLKETLAREAFTRMISAFAERGDETSLAHGIRLLKLYPDIAARKYPQAEVIVRDLERRRLHGTFSKKPPEAWPEGFQRWGQAKEIAWLIESLDEVDATQCMDEPPRLEFDRRFEALVEIGDPAVPALIDRVEKDDRLSRTMHSWAKDLASEEARRSTILGVREIALAALMDILKTSLFEPRRKGTISPG